MREWFAAGAIAAGLGVLLGAFGAHGLKSRVGPDLLVVFETGVRYHMYHALALFAVAWAQSRAPSAWGTVAGCLFLIGIVLFSGSLYALALTGVTTWGAVTPIGGLAFLIGWACLAFFAAL